jgi:hypothetical protein
MYAFRVSAMSTSEPQKMPADASQIEAESAADAAPKGDGEKVRLVTMDALDRRTKAAQYALELRDELIGERGGEKSMSAMSRALVEDIAMTSTMIRDMQVRWLRGAPVSASELCTLINTRRRLLESPEVSLPSKSAETRDEPEDLREVARMIYAILAEAGAAERHEKTMEGLN